VQGFYHRARRLPKLFTPLSEVIITDEKLSLVRLVMSIQKTSTTNVLKVLVVIFMTICQFFLNSPRSLGAAGGYRISSFSSVGPDAKTVIIEAGALDGVSNGDVFIVSRLPEPSIRNLGVAIETGTVKAIAVYESKTIAEITQNSTPLSLRFFPKFPEIMAGDLATRERLDIRPSLALTPEITIPYSKLFEDPNSNPRSFELSNIGTEMLDMEAERIASMKVSHLMIIGHTDAKGSIDANQVESLQRAMVVREFLINKLGFDPEKVSAIGKGEDDLPEESLSPGYAQRARRVVISTVNIQ
jgi:outer membrane protein OmpA-like peptidoglycan-associated protein